MKQLTEGQRYELQAYLQAGIKKDEIAHLLGIHRSTLYRELCRNKWNPTDSYDADYAQYLSLIHISLSRWINGCATVLRSML